MQRHEMIEALGQLGLKGMAGAFDDAVTTGLQRNRTATLSLKECSKPAQQGGLLRFRV